MQILKLINQKFNQAEERSTIIQSKKLERKKRRTLKHKTRYTEPNRREGELALNSLTWEKTF